MKVCPCHSRTISPDPSPSVFSVAAVPAWLGLILLLASITIMLTGCTLLRVVSGMYGAEHPPTPTESTPRPRVTVATPTAGPTPTSAPALETAVPIGGICQETHAGATPHAFFADKVEKAERDWIAANPDKWRRVAAQWNVAREFWDQNDTDVVRALRADGLDAVIEAEGNGGSNGSIAVAARGDASFHEGYSIRVSSGDVRFPFNGNAPNGFMGRCEPRGFAVGVWVEYPTAAPTSTAPPVPTPTKAAMACPALLWVDANRKNGTPRFPGDAPGKFCWLVDITPRFLISGKNLPCNAEKPDNCGEAGRVYPFSGEACEPDPEALAVTYQSAGGPNGAFSGYSGRVCGPIGSDFKVTVKLKPGAVDKAGREIAGTVETFTYTGAI